MTLERERLSIRDFRRKLINYVMVTALFLAAVAAIVPLLNIFIYILRQGLPAIDLAFFTKLPAPVGETGGGMANAILGTLMLVGMACLIGIPFGVAAGIFLAEYGKTRIANILRFAADLLGSIPSIIIGLFAYAVIVKPMGGFSAYAGALALAVIMIPTVARTTEELLKLVPNHIREAGLALGIPRWKVTLRIVVRGSLGGIVTGLMLSVARAAGETAPLLFTALNNQFWPRGLDQPVSSLPVQIFTYAISPFDEWHRQAWAGALLLVAFIFVLNFFTRMALSRPAPSKD